MATNLPVVATRFPGLAENFHEGSGIRFLASADDIVKVILEVLALSQVPSTREQVASLSWQAITAQLCAYYQECLRQKP
jgi:glycosyltransferase involved in cell wall biosynthesis